MATTWLDSLKSAQKTCLIQDGRRKIHFTFKDGTQMAEEYDLGTNELSVRKWKRKGTLGGEGKWEFEVGEPMRSMNLDTDGMVESSGNPIFTRKDKVKAFQWRIRNLPYPLDTYNVTADPENRVVIIRTTNKKYYKKFAIPDLDRLKAPLDGTGLSFAHANNTLIVTYEKPAEVLQLEQAMQQEFKKLKGIKEGDVDSCNPS